MRTCGFYNCFKQATKEIKTKSGNLKAQYCDKHLKIMKKREFIKKGNYVVLIGATKKMNKFVRDKVFLKEKDKEIEKLKEKIKEWKQAFEIITIDYEDELKIMKKELRNWKDEYFKLNMKKKLKIS